MTTTTLTPDAEIFGYTTVAGAMLDRTNAPRGEVVFKENNATIAEAEPAEDQLAVIQMLLPQNFAYVLVDLFLQVQALDAEDWEKAALVVINVSEDTSIKFNLVGTDISTFTAPGLQSVGYNVVNLPRAIVRPVGMGTSVSINVGNVQEVGLEAGLSLYARFLQYDIAQHHDVAVNLPTLIR